MSAYDTHQRLRTKGNRLLRKKAYEDAIKTIGDGAIEMLEQKEQGSGCDLGVYLADIYEQADRSCDEESRSRLVKIISLAANDFWRKKVIDTAIKWSVQASGNPAGDSQLRLSIAEVLAKEGSYYAAEAHYIAACVPAPAGSSASVPEHAANSFALMMVEWMEAFAKELAAQAGEKRDAAMLERIDSGKWALRGLMPLLALNAAQAAKAFLETFIARLATKHSSLLLPMTPNPRPYTPPPGAEGSVALPSGLQLYVTANPDLEFGQTALALCLHATAIKSVTSSSSSRIPDGLKVAWVNLVRQYEREGVEAVHEHGIEDAISTISTNYFELQAQRPQGNFMQDMLSSLMGGGSQHQNRQGQNADGQKGKVQALVVKQVPNPEVGPSAQQTTGSGDQKQASSSSAPAAPAVEAPEEEDLD